MQVDPCGNGRNTAHRLGEPGPPCAALFDKTGRRTRPTKQACTDGVLVVTDDTATRPAPDDPPSVRTKTLSAYTTMAGTQRLSRALALLGVEPEHTRPPVESPSGLVNSLASRRA